ncbi:MAG TPA: hypothetical protein VF228_23825 [Iamia sp.]
MTVLRISGLLWRRGGARQWTVLGLTAAGVLAATTLALLALSVSPALGARGDRTAWRTATPATDPASATAVQRTTTDAFRGREITRVELAPTGVGRPPRPPGLDRFPAPGEIVLSPALAALVAAEPRAALGDRFPGTVIGELGPAGRAIDDDLVVVVGRAPGEIEIGADAGTPITGYAAAGQAANLADYQVMSQLAAVLLVVPTVLLVGALARLTAAQREQRLAGLRLVGATPGLVVAVTALETALAALVGAAGGVVLYLAVLPVAARVELAGAAFAPDDLRLGAGALLATLAVVPVLGATSATVALRKVVIGPLGVSRRVTGRRPRLVRLLVVPVAWVALVAAAAGLADGGSVAPVLLGLGAVIATLAVVGPWLTWIVGALMARLGRRPGPVLAGRRITDDARGTYRTVSGMVLAGLIAGFLFGVIPTIRQVAVDVEQLDGATDLSVTVATDRTDAVEGVVGVPVDWSREGGRSTGTVVAEAGTDVEVVRTAVLAADPTADVSSAADLAGETSLLVDDMGRASVVMALAALALATVATAIGSTASILDQRVTLARLRLAGTSLAVLQRARRWQAVVPLGLASVGAMASGAAAAQILMVAVGAREEQVVGPDLAPMVALGLAALAAGVVAIALTRPVLVAATRATPRE